MVKNRLKEIRMREYMMSAGEFAKYLGTDIKNYSNWERNVSRPNLEKALEISKKLNRTVNDIWYLE
ncbi:helix-turn-helix transcriptional regulator [Caloramator sp. Dgby_cultured_2]|uniref:helix-turn-helix transcriptional regulator n=1 Tax=Caloramator sp. Dgby_cultured_2 TaxID=3029174 RepID=UPI00237D412D|nr:helix-turn-helix domain-containing protein [Caloramator sp. Dgby_cultured_2]WDU82247.1 helix-turn-helix domain-containing protein [Caloramator sp. Dgby_cultured_2]